MRSIDTLSHKTLRLSALGLALVALAAVLPAGEALAQVRPAYVKNVDEPGRVPYQQMVEFSIAAPTCPVTSFCIVSFNAVPAGKRLVVEHLSMLIGVAGGGQPNLLAFGDQFSTNTGNVAIVPPRFTPGVPVSGVVFWSLNEPVRVYYEAGQVPKVKVNASTNFGFVANASLHGYLIDASN
jgi:hypothetical protein